MMYTKIRKTPCNKCRKPKCEELYCESWRAWFQESWDAMNRVAQREAAIHGHKQEEKILVALPHEGDPCKSCVRNPWCDVACSARLMWWDQSMARLRGVMK